MPNPGASQSALALCPAPADASHASCFGSLRTDGTITKVYPDAVNGLTPNDLSSLYAYPRPGWQGLAGRGQVVAVVVAYDYAGAESDLAVYRAHFGLWPCTSRNGCFSKVGAATAQAQSSTGNPESISAHPTTLGAIGWAAEADADIEVISAVCPNCKIVLAEAASDSMADLTNAVAAALQAKATIINASYGAPETQNDSQFVPTYENGQHIKTVAAAGDWGFGVYFPASASKVIAVGGTSLSVSGSTVTETAWSGTGSGCSQYFGKQGWQNTPQYGCHNRAVVDVAAVADPATGVAFYDSSLYGSSGAWAIIGGTSIAAPIVTGMYALSGNTAAGEGAQQLYANSGGFLPVTSGSNGSCSPSYLCTAVSGYNGPTGLGVPNGLGGF